MIDGPKLSYNSRSEVGLSLGITELLIKKLVYSFYALIREDLLLGPIFKNAINNNWEEHLTRMCDFWSSIALGTGRYKGKPLLKHINLPELDKEHFLQWIFIFEKNAYSVCNKEIADFFVAHSQKIAQSIMRSIILYRNKDYI